jgi:hypothetical protein
MLAQLRVEGAVQTAEEWFARRARESAPE